MTQAYNLAILANAVDSSGKLNVGTNATGTLPVANGGTGAATLTANNVLLGNGTSALQVVAPGTNGNVLTSNGTTWTSAALSNVVTSLNGQTGAITNTSKNAIGSIWLASDGSVFSVATLNGGTTAGSNLTYFNGSDNVSAGLSGTWRGLGAQSTARGVVFMRVS